MGISRNTITGSIIWNGCGLAGQDRSFNTFIPLKFRNKDHDMSDVPESSVVEDMKMYAVARLYMDNFPHLKAYWPMLEGRAPS